MNYIKKSMNDLHETIVGDNANSFILISDDTFDDLEIRFDTPHKPHEFTNVDKAEEYIETLKNVLQVNKLALEKYKEKYETFSTLHARLEELRQECIANDNGRELREAKEKAESAQKFYEKLLKENKNAKTSTV